MKKSLIAFVFFFLHVANVNASPFTNSLEILEDNLKNYKLMKAREYLGIIQFNGLTKEEWIKVRDLIHKYPQIGLDILLQFDKTSPYAENKIDIAIKNADKLMSEKKFRTAANNYQVILQYITKNKKFKEGRNIQLYWSLIHSLARAFYGLKQYDEAHQLYQTIPSSYPFYKQVQFELMWNSYMNERFDYALGAIASISSGNFSKVLEPEVFLVQYYIYKRLCRDKDAEIIKQRVKAYQKALELIELQLGSWIKKDVFTLMYKQILLSGDLNNEETKKLKEVLENEKNKDFDRLLKEFDLVNAHLEIDSGKNINLRPIKTFLTLDQINKSNVVWKVNDNEAWSDEVGKFVYIQKDLCKIDLSK